MHTLYNLLSGVAETTRPAVLTRSPQCARPPLYSLSALYPLCLSWAKIYQHQISIHWNLIYRNCKLIYGKLIYDNCFLS